MKYLKACATTVLLATVSPLAVLAQEAVSAAERIEDEQAEMAKVVITGSRISRQDYEAHTPIVTLSNELLERTGAVTLDTALKQLPQFVASTGSTTNSNGNGGQANIQLRGLGRQRTLVLLDGRRLPPANSDGSADLNMIPTALVGSVEIITGGASAVYGSDAIAGVVNIRTKTNFEGAELSLQYGMSEDGDAEDYKIGLITGGSFDSGRGSTLFVLDYADRKPVFVSDRDFSIGSSRDSLNPSGDVSFGTNRPSQAALDQIFGSYGVAPGTVTGANSIGFNPDGSLYSSGQTLQNFLLAADPLYTVVGNRVFAEGRQYRYLQLPLERYSAFNKTSYSLTSNIDIFGQILYTHSEAARRLNPLPLPSNPLAIAPVPVTNPFIPDDLAALLASRPNPTAPIALSKRADAFGVRQEDSESDTFQIAGGLEGDFADGQWTWDVTGTYGRNSISTTRPDWLSIAALTRLVNAPDGGISLCAGGFNPFGNNPVSAECISYATRTVDTRLTIEQQTVEASLQGSPFSLPAGAVNIAVGASYREDSLKTVADPLLIEGDIIAAAGTNFSGRTDVTEAYMEVLVPLLRDLPLVERLDVNFAGRLSDYSTVGQVGTYKGDLSWQLTGAFSLRGGYERAIRAPSIGELFTPSVRGLSIIGMPGSLGTGDPCDVNGAYRTGPNAAQVRDLCLATGVPAAAIDTFTQGNQSVGAISGGNSALREETADTYSVGAIWQPKFNTPLLANLRGSLDYYSIEVADAVGAITAPLTLSRCFNATGDANPAYNPNSVFCQQIERNPDGSIFNISAQSLNLAGYRTSGWDLQLDWSADVRELGIPDDGRLSLNLLTNYVDNFEIQSLPGDPYLDYAGTIGNGQIDPVAITRPTWKSNLHAGYARGPFDIGLTWRYIGKADNAANVGATTASAQGVPAVSYFDLNGTFDLNESAQIWATMVNVGNKQPPVYPSTGSTDAATYDPIGRRFTVGVRLRF